MSATREEIEAGQAVYTPKMLAIYDLLVLGLSNRFIWKCPTPRLLAHYDLHVSANHLDVGVGTGYFLDRCRFPSATPRVALMDMNRNALAFAARRIARYAPETHARNVLDEIAFEGERFDSVGINYLLHCLPGDMAAKARAFDCIAPLMNPGAVIFGSTLLQGGVERGAAARRLMAFYNSKGRFLERPGRCGDAEARIGEALQRRVGRSRPLCGVVLGAGVSGDLSRPAPAPCAPARSSRTDPAAEPAVPCRPRKP